MAKKKDPPYDWVGPEKTKFVKDAAKKMRKGYDEVYESPKAQCTLDGCVADQMSGSGGLCKTHHLERIDREEAERKKTRRASRKARAKLDASPKLQMKVMDDEKRYKQLREDPFCKVCGQYISSSKIGRARKREIQPAHITHRCRNFETICKRCERKKY